MIGVQLWVFDDGCQLFIWMMGAQLKQGQMASLACSASVRIMPCQGPMYQSGR